MSVPWAQNRKAKFLSKAVKYTQILHVLKHEYPTGNIDQITNIIDVFGGYGQHLHDRIGKILTRKSEMNLVFNKGGWRKEEGKP